MWLKMSRNDYENSIPYLNFDKISGENKVKHKLERFQPKSARQL